jgi:aspartate ammonia-lyase
MKVVEDAYGKVSVPDDALYGPGTGHTLENMSFSGEALSGFPEYVRAAAQVKMACARANVAARVIPAPVGSRIEAACERLIQGEFRDQFVVDVYEGGGGTGVNMNFNEVIASLAGPDVRPVDDVNASQSTSDACHTALRLALLALTAELDEVVGEVAASVSAKGDEFRDVMTIARTCWQDGMEIPVSSIFDGLAAALGRRRELLVPLRVRLHQVNLGWTVVGSGTGATDAYRGHILGALRTVTGEPMEWRSSPYDAAQNPDDLADVSAEVRTIAALLSKFARDLRVLSSGPETGLRELRLPAVQAGSSFYPGKVNPVVPEAMIQCAILISGNDVALQSCLEMGEAQLNIWEEMMGFLLMRNIRMLVRAARLLKDRCIDGIEVDAEQCRKYATSFIPAVVAYKEKHGYEQVSRWLKEMSREELLAKMKEEQ